MSILLAGASGQLGQELRKKLPKHDVVALDRKLIASATSSDLTDAILNSQVKVVINCAAYTNVDQAEREPEVAYHVNEEIPKRLAEACANTEALLIHFSTDYVFDGTKRTPYLESDEPNPLSVYGRSKLLGEQAIAERLSNFFIFRVSWLFSEYRRNFLLTMIRAAKDKRTLNVVNDVWGCPTWTGTVADAVTSVVSRSHTEEAIPPGLYHLCNGGITTWFGFAQEIFKDLNSHPIGSFHPPPELIPIPSFQYQAPATRPQYSALDTTKFVSTTGIQLKKWQTALSECLYSMNDLGR